MEEIICGGAGLEFQNIRGEKTLHRNLTGLKDLVLNLTHCEKFSSECDKTKKLQFQI